MRPEDVWRVPKVGTRTAAHLRTIAGSEATGWSGGCGLVATTLPSEMATISCRWEGFAPANAARTRASVAVAAAPVTGEPATGEPSPISTNSCTRSASVSRARFWKRTIRVATTDAVSAMATRSVHHNRIRTRVDMPDRMVRRRLPGPVVASLSPMCRRSSRGL